MVAYANAKYIKGTKLLQKLEEKLFLMRQNCLASSIVLKIQNDDNKIQLFTGLPSYGVFNVLVTHLTPFVSKDKSLGSGLSLADEVLVTLLKLSQALTNQMIVTIFDINETKSTKIFHRWINVMFKGLQPLVVWPDKEATCLIARAQIYSSYKGRNTVKFLVSITPTGAVSFISKCWGGRVSDCHLKINSGFLRK